MEPYFRDKLKTEFERRCRRNPGYSLRAFARFLDLHPGTLSAAIAGKRGLPKHSLAKVTARLELSEKQARLFRRSAFTHAGELPETERELVEVEDRHERLIAEWEYYALLNLVETGDFEQDPAWIASRLGVDEERVQRVVKDLVDWGFLDTDGKIWKRIPKTLRTTEDVTSNALRQAHREELVLAASAIDSVPVDLRDFSSVTLPMSVATMPKAKALIRQFRQDLLACLETDQADEVYQLCIQFFPLTKRRES